MGFRITYPIPAAIGGGAAFTGGQGELLRYLQQRQLQYDELAQRDMMQQRALNFEAGQQRNALNARLLDQQLGAAVDLTRMGMQAELTREGRDFAAGEAVKGRTHDLARDSSMAQRHMAELEFGRQAELEDQAAQLDMMEGAVAGGMDLSILPDGPLKTRIGELMSALDEVKSDPKYNDQQRVAARRRIVGELQGLTGSYDRQKKPPKTMEEEWESNVIEKPAGTMIRQPDGKFDFVPNKNEDPNTLRMEQVAKLNESRAKAIQSYIDAQVKIRTATAKTAGPPVTEIDPETGQATQVPGPELTVPAFSPQEAEAMLAPIRNDINTFTQEIEALKAETHDNADMAGGDDWRFYNQPFPGQQQAQGPQVPPPPQPAPPDQQQGPSPLDALQTMPEQQLQNIAQGHTHPQMRQAAQEVLDERLREYYRSNFGMEFPGGGGGQAGPPQVPATQRPPQGFDFPGGDPSKVPLPVVRTPEDFARLKLEPGDLFIDANDGQTKKLKRKAR